MLYIFTGTDTVTAKKKALKLAAGCETVRFGEGGEPLVNALGYIGARGMFSSKIALILDCPLETDEGAQLLSEHMKVFAEADASVFVIEPNLTARAHSHILKNIRMIAGVVLESFDEEKKDIEPLVSVFALTDAFASGNRKNAWILYRKFIEGGMAPEEIHGALSWQARALVLASNAQTAGESGLKPFVYSKAKRFATRFAPGEAENLSRELVSLYHESRAGRGILSDLLEIFLLKKTGN